MKKVLLFAVPIGLVALLLTAQATHSFGFGRGHHAVAKDFLFYKLDKMSKDLNLDPSQQAKIDNFKQELDSIIDQRLKKRDEIREVAKNELSKENPDLAKITPLIDQHIDEAAQIGHDLVNRFDEFYNDLTPEQRKLFSQRLLEKIHERETED